MDDFLSRCIPYVMKNERLEQQHAIAKCAGIYRQHKKKKGQHEGEEGERRERSIG